jgi:hypothetical protein
VPGSPHAGAWRTKHCILTANYEPKSRSQRTGDQFDEKIVIVRGALNKEINAALADPKMKARLSDFGGTALPGSLADFGKLIADETEKWAKVIRAANIKVE